MRSCYQFGNISPTFVRELVFSFLISVWQLSKAKKKKEKKWVENESSADFIGREFGLSDGVIALFCLFVLMGKAIFAADLFVEASFFVR